MVCGTASDAGKSTFVTALCRLLARRGVRVAPFKAQNMALNSYVTLDGHEIGRAQAVQALAAGVEPDVAMNPILLKPTGERTSQIILRGRPIGVMTAQEYHSAKPALLETVLADLDDLRRRFDVVVCEGAGSPAEINLLDHDIVNLRVAREAGLPAVLVGDIDRGGVFAALYGTVALLPDDLRPLVRAFVVNKFRGDPALLTGAVEDLERRCGVPSVGVLPMLPAGVVGLDAEDSLALDTPWEPAGPPLADALDVAVVRLPCIANVTDLDPLAIEPGVTVRLARSPSALGRPDLVVVPGTKATVEDLSWLRAGGWPEAIAASGAEVVGVCGGYQMLGTRIIDGVESSAPAVDGLGWLPVETTFATDKVTRRVHGPGVDGYLIHHGRVSTAGPAWVQLDEGAEGCVSPDGRFRGTAVHGLFEHDSFRGEFLTELAARRYKRFVPTGVRFAAARTRRFDVLADAVAEHLDVRALELLIARGAP
jgi:adenosylcobyric acid synthase